jgi:hypothetical protein
VAEQRVGGMVERKGVRRERQIGRHTNHGLVNGPRSWPAPWLRVRRCRVSCGGERETSRWKIAARQSDSRRGVWARFEAAESQRQQMHRGGTSGPL